MGQVMCMVASSLLRRSSMVAMRLARYIEESQWQALVSWSRRDPHPVNYTALAALLAAPLPLELDRPRLERLRAECGQVAHSSLDGPALDGFSRLVEFVEQATEILEAYSNPPISREVILNIGFQVIGRA